MVTLEEIKPILRPRGVKSGVMRVDKEKCNSCGLCIKNCPFQCWAMGEDKKPYMREGAVCFSCSNCMIPCPTDAISMVESYYVEKGEFFDFGWPPYEKPVEPRDGEGKPDKWTAVEQAVYERRSVRNFKKKPVPEELIERVLEAGRFAPSAGNNQSWKFIAVTNRDFISQMESAVQAFLNTSYQMFADDSRLMDFATAFDESFQPKDFDPRPMHGLRCVAHGDLKVFLNEPPVVIFLTSHANMIQTEKHIGICGQNMNLVAHSLGLGMVWTGIGATVEILPELKAKLGVEAPWHIAMAMSLGYPKFKQNGIVARQKRSVAWFR